MMFGDSIKTCWYWNLDNKLVSIELTARRWAYIEYDKHGHEWVVVREEYDVEGYPPTNNREIKRHNVHNVAMIEWVPK